MCFVFSYSKYEIVKKRKAIFIALQNRNGVKIFTTNRWFHFHLYFPFHFNKSIYGFSSAVTEYLFILYSCSFFVDFHFHQLINNFLWVGECSHFHLSLVCIRSIITTATRHISGQCYDASILSIKFSVRGSFEHYKRILSIRIMSSWPSNW